MATSITWADLTVNFDHLDRQEVVRAWTWLLGPNKLPILISPVGAACHFDLAGQIHEQIRALPDGTEVNLKAV